MNLVLIGYGAMGRQVEAAAAERRHSIVARFSSKNPLSGIPSGFFRNHAVDCCIDFSVSSLVRSHAEICGRAGVPLVEGTTGWQNERDDVLEYVNQLDGTFVYGNNFSIGAQLFFYAVRTAAELMNNYPEYDAAVHEVHHTRKKDAPSGTAVHLAHLLLSALERKSTAAHTASGIPSRPDQLSVSSARIGTVCGTHSVLFHSPADEIELTHRAHDRSGFAAGAVVAAEMCATVRGIHRFEDLLFQHSHHQQKGSL